MSDELYGWDRYDPAKAEARERLKDALVLDFNHMFGTDVNDIRNWHKLCRTINIHPIPEGLQACREVIRAYVFLVYLSGY